MLAADEKPEVFRGHIGECIQHLSDRINTRVVPYSRGAGVVKQPIATFCGVSVATVTRWLNDKEGQIPVGECLLKLECWLDLHGYRVIELENMARSHRNFVELIGFGVLSSEAAATEVGYSSPANLLSALREGRFSRDKEARVWKAWTDRREVLEQTKALARQKYHLSIDLGSRQSTPELKVAAVPPDVSVGSVDGAVQVMQGLLTWFDADVFHLSDDQISALPKLSGDTILRLSAHLTTLSSRLMMSGKRKRGPKHGP